MHPDHRLQPPMQVNPSRPGTRRATEEDHAWAQLYRDIGQPSTAEEVVKHLDKKDNIAVRDQHMALYLRAKDTLRRHAEAKARAQRVGLFLRQVVFYGLINPVVQLFNGVRWLFTWGGEAGLEAMPLTASPAVARVRELKKDPEIAPAITSLASQAEPSRRVDAA